MTGTLEHLDPATLLIGANVRDDASLDKQFVASVREHGVLQPITAIRIDGGIEVRDGQRRTLAAREAHLASIPVYVLDPDTDNTTVAAAERIAVQIVANDQRTALTDAQRAKGISQMLLAGVSPADAAATVGESATAFGALASGQLSLTGAAALTEFIVMWTHARLGCQSTVME
jgi:ParB family chromosome partitioning protein